MARSTCPKPGCDSHRFELAEVSPAQSLVKMHFVQCATCGTVVTTVPFAHTNTILDDVEVRLENIETALGALSRR